MSTSEPGFRSFFVRLWLWHVLLTAVLAVVLLLCFFHFTGLKVASGYAWANLIGFVAAAVHSLILLILAVRLLARNRLLHGGCFALHFFVASALCYWAYLMLIGTVISALLN
ncbi:MAG: hypothetical protein IM638_13535 [Bacteroidetes bacterium]|nr:hypothetical protein [Bacteroidota bacterium]